MPFSLNSLANVAFFIISIHGVIYLFLIVSSIKEFKCFLNSEVAC
jgi:hypothetical protein